LIEGRRRTIRGIRYARVAVGALTRASKVHIMDTGTESLRFQHGLERRAKKKNTAYAPRS
jgi:hypothetical protein